MIPIYIILDWRYPGGAIVTCSVSLLFLVFLHVLLSLFHTLKFFFKKRLIVSQEEEHLNS